MNSGSFTTNYSLREIFESFTYGHGNLSLPVYIANYIFDILATMFPIFVIFLFGVTSYKLLKHSDIKRQIKEQAVYMSLIIIVVYLTISIPGIHKYNNKSTYLVIDAYSSILKTGEDLADALTYSILFNGGTQGSDIYSPSLKPTAKTELNGFFDNKTVLHKVLEDSKLSASQKAKFVKEFNEKNKLSKEVLIKPYSLKPFEKIAIIYYTIGALNTRLGYREKPLSAQDIKDGNKNISDFLDKNFTILFGDEKIAGIYAEDIFSSNDTFISYLKLSDMNYYVLHNKAVGPYDKIVANLLEAYIDILDEQIKRLKQYRTRSGLTNVPDLLKQLDDYIYTLSASKNLYELVLEAGVKNLYSDKLINVEYYEQYANTNKNNIIYYKSIFDLHKNALDSLLYSNKGKSLAGLVGIHTYVNNMNTYYNNKKTPINPEDLNSVVNMYFNTLVSFIPKANLAITPDIQNMIPNDSNQDFISYSLAPLIPLMKNANARYYNASDWKEASLAINSKMKNSYTFYDQYVSNNNILNNALEKYKKEKKQTLASLAKRHYGVDSVNESRKISWVDLGFFYTLLKNHYAEKIITDSYIALNELNNIYLQADSVELEQKIHGVSAASNYIKSHSDYEKSKKLIITGATVYGIATGVKDLIDSIVKSMTGESTIFSKITSLFKISTKVVGSGVLAVAKGAFSFVIAYVILSVLSNLIFIMLPSLIWMLAVVAWFFKTSIMIALIPINIFLIFFESKQQAVKSMLFNLVGQALVPVTMVAIFFIVMLFSTELELVLDKFIPMLNANIASMDSNNGKILTNVVGFFDPIASFITLVFKTLIMLVINTQLYMQFFRADDYVSEVLGERVSYGQTISGGDVMSKLYVGRHI